MSVVAVIVIVLVAVLLAAMLIAGRRRAAASRARASAGEDGYEPRSFRSHAEASRHSPDRGRP